MAPLISIGQQNRLEFVTGFISRKAVAREANISYHRLTRLAREGIALTGDEAKRMLNVSRKFSYTALRKAGMSARQARRFRGGSMATIGELKSRMDSIQDYLSEGAFASMKKARDIRGIAYDEDLLMSDAQDAVYNGLRRSRKTIEDWENY